MVQDYSVGIECIDLMKVQIKMTRLGRQDLQVARKAETKTRRGRVRAVLARVWEQEDWARK